MAGPIDESSLGDPIVAEIHAIRQQPYDKYNGDLRAYSQAATANALALRFQIRLIKKPVSAVHRSDRESAKFDMTDLSSKLTHLEHCGQRLWDHQRHRVLDCLAQLGQNCAMKKLSQTHLNKN